MVTFGVGGSLPQVGASHSNEHSPDFNVTGLVDFHLALYCCLSLTKMSRNADYATQRIFKKRLPVRDFICGQQSSGALERYSNRDGLLKSAMCERIYL